MGGAVFPPRVLLCSFNSLKSILALSLSLEVVRNEADGLLVLRVDPGCSSKVSWESQSCTTGGPRLTTVRRVTEVTTVLEKATDDHFSGL